MKTARIVLDERALLAADRDARRAGLNRSALRATVAPITSTTLRSGATRPYELSLPNRGS
jgi:hypothetical protein